MILLFWEEMKMQKKNMKISVENVITVLRNQGKTVYEMSYDNGEQAFFYEELDAEMERQTGQCHTVSEDE